MCCAFSGPKGRDSIAQGAALGHEPARQGQPQRGETPAKSPGSHAPLGLVNVRRPGTQGCALDYRVWPRWGQVAKKNTGFRSQNNSVKTNFSSPYRSPGLERRHFGGEWLLSILLVTSYLWLGHSVTQLPSRGATRPLCGCAALPGYPRNTNDQWPDNFHSPTGVRGSPENVALSLRERKADEPPGAT